MRTFWSRPLISVLLAVTAAFYGCRQGGDDGGNGSGDGSGEGDATARWLTGDWTGNYKNKDAEEGSSLRETTAKATFKITEDGKRVGDFVFDFPLLEDVKVSGTFRDFAGKSLMLTIKHSDISTIGNSGSTTDMSYDLVGDSLELYNERVRLRLVREGEATDDGGDEGDDGEQKASNPLFYRWTCNDARGYVWEVNVKDASKFTIDVFEDNGASLWMDGSVALQAEGAAFNAALTVTSAQIAKYEGMELQARLTGAYSMELKRLGQNGETMGCVRQ